MKILVLFLLCLEVFGANWFVRPNGGTYGAENGTDWSNAYDGFTDITWASAACGDTIWVAGGTYTQDLNTGKSCTSGNPIWVRRARADASACTSATGWSSGFDANIEHVAKTINYGNHNYINISGATTASGGTFGWHITWSGQTQGTGIEWPNDATGSNAWIEYIDIEGPGNITYTSDGRGIDLTPFSSATNITFSHVKVHDWESTVYCGGASNVTFEYSEFYNVRAINSATFHPNMIYVTNCPSLTYRYNYAHDPTGEGIFFTNNDTNVTGTQAIYGNLWRNISDKAIQPDNTGTITILLYNNTFENITGQMILGDATYVSTESRNNIVSRCSNSCTLIGTASNNLVTSTAGVFVDRAGGDLHIVSTTGAGFARDAGTSLSSPYNVDRDGVTRGGDGTFDIGAYEYTSGADTTPPVRSSGSPSGSIAYTTSTTISLTTDESATCKWSSTSGVAYASMTNTFTIGGLSNLTSVSVSVGSNTFYVRCIDGSSNANTDDFTITFTVNTAAPVVTTTSASSITSSSASSGGNVTSDGGATVTVRGVCRSTSANPTTSDTCTSDGTGTGSYSSSLTGLAPNTLYHIRAYATNSVGTSYGSDQTFTTSTTIRSKSGVGIKLVPGSKI